jgi:hypothetical protein
LNFKSKNLEEYNCPLSLDELRKSLDKAHDTACGHDDVHYQLLKHLPESALQVLLDLMNDIWETGDLPSIWKLTNVIPIPKPQTLFIGVWQFNLETKLHQEVRRFCFNVLRAFAPKMRKLPRLDVFRTVVRPFCDF